MSGRLKLPQKNEKAPRMRINNRLSSSNKTTKESYIITGLEGGINREQKIKVILYT